jgi:transcription elongation factor SPT4
MDTGYLRNGAVFPDKLKQLRACLSCRLIKTTEQWRAEGCENCGDKYHGIDAFSYTTPTFKGSEAQTTQVAEYAPSTAVKRSLCLFCLDAVCYSTIVMMRPGKSWVARWQKQEAFKAGMYAIQVTGTAPAEENYNDNDE